MDWLIPAQTAALAGTSLLALLFWYLYSDGRCTYLKLWAAAWAVYAFRFVVQLAGGLLGAPLATAVVAQCVTLLSGVLLLAGTCAYLSRPLPKAALAAGGIGLLLIVAIPWAGAAFGVLAGPGSVVAAAAYAWTGGVILRSPAVIGVGRNLAGWALLAWSGLKLSHPLWTTAGVSTPGWFLAAAFLEISVAAGFLLMYSETTRSELAQSAERLRQLVQGMPVMLDAFDPQMNFIAWNRECERVTGYASAEIIGNPRALETLYPDPAQRAGMLADIAASGFNFRDREWELTTRHGERRTIAWSNLSRDLPMPGWHTWAVGVDVTPRRRVEQDLRIRVHQQETVAMLGQVALAGGDAAGFLKGAVQSIARELAVEFCEVLELLPEGDRLIFRATLPDLDHLVDRETVAAGRGSQAGYTLLSREPVTMADIDAETRFSPHHLMRAHGIVSGMSAVIGGRERAFGVLNASTTRRRTFTKDDTLFLQSVANVLAAAIERKQAEEALRRQEQAARKLAQEEAVMAEIGRIIGSTLTIEDVYEQFAAEVKKILPFDRISIN
nr:GAF domain-containing protein [Desulfobacterales bacterium]